MILELLAIKEINKPKPLPQPKPVQTVQVVPKPKPKTIKPKHIAYKVKSGDTLTTISKARRVPVSRLWSANRQLRNPDVIRVGERLKIPRPSDKLKKRAMIKPVGTRDTIKSEAPTLPKLGGFSSSGNSYEPGQCVWALKNWRPELPNTWGNASDWLYNAQRDSWATGSTPRVGAVGWTPTHVVLIVGVNKDGTVDIKDMNGRYIPYEIGHGTYPASKYQYIY